MARASEEQRRMTSEDFKCRSRLPKFAIPRRYDLRIHLHLDEFTFAGCVEITLEIRESTRFLVLNAADLSIDPSSISFLPRTPACDCEHRPNDVITFKDDEILVLEFHENLPLGEGILGIRFTGTLNDNMKGFYRSTYEHNGEKRNMAVTQFEPADARRCFPCWDEPAFKATFKITLEVPFELVALSNMPIIEEEIDKPFKTISFEESPIMSTYLVAVVVGLFDYIEDVSSDGTMIRVFCPVGKASQGKFALDVAVQTLVLYKDYFGLSYPLPKLDMVAIPDFAAGAMENYGLVTYRDAALLHDDNHSSASSKQGVAITVAHELAHQWFGNLVTMEWWTHLWLNEGFATWVSFLATDSLFPDWNIWTQFLHSTTNGLRLDSLSESHPIEVDINHANEINEIFDGISYNKGAALIRMLETYLGASCFQRSMSSYIEKYAYSNASTEDLWAVLEQESREPVRMIMSTWTKKKGYPVISVKMEGHVLEFEQSHFLSSGSSGEGEWIVPITLCCNSYKVQKKFLLTTKSGKLDMTKHLGPDKNASREDKNFKHAELYWVKLNVEQSGFYRVKYHGELAAGLKYAIESYQLSATDRYGVLEDAYALCKAGHEKLSSLLSLMDAYRKESDHTVIQQMITISCSIVSVAADAIPELLDEIKKFMINIFLLPSGSLGWDRKEGESHLDALLRGELLCALTVFGHDITRSEAIRRFNIFLDDRSTPLLPPDTRKAAYYAVMNASGISSEGYESLLRVYRESETSAEKTRVLGLLASASDQAIVLEALNFLLSAEVRKQDAVYGIYGVSRKGKETAWRWLKEHWDGYISKNWGSGFLHASFISAIVSKFNSDDKADEVEEFFKSRRTPLIERTLKQSIERVRNSSKWVDSIRNDSILKQVLANLECQKW